MLKVCVVVPLHADWADIPAGHKMSGEGSANASMCNIEQFCAIAQNYNASPKFGVGAM